MENNIYHWIFCYKDNKYHPEKIGKLSFPFKIKDKEIEISKRTLEGYIIRFSKEYLEKKVDFKKVLDIFIRRTGGRYYDGILITDSEEGFADYWLITVNLFQILFKKFPIVDDMSEKLLKNIYSNPNLPIMEKLIYGIAYLFAYYRLRELEKRGKKIIVKE